MGRLQPDQTPIAKASGGLVVLVVSLSYLAYVFRPLEPAFWTTGLGDWMDPYFINYLLEHWYQSLVRLNDPASPPMYFPARHTLGYSHGLVLYALFYVPFRLFFHPFQAYSLALFAVMETGILCLYALLRNRFQLTFIESVLLTVFFFTSVNVVNGSVSVWSQRASVFLIPPLLCIGAASYAARRSRGGIVGGAATGFLATLLYTHDFYTAHFAWFFAALALIAFGGMPLRAHFSWFRESFRWPERAAVAGGILSLLWTWFVVTSGGAEVHVLGLRIASHDWRRPALVTALCVAALIALRGAPRLIADVARIDPWFRALAAGAAAGVLVFLWIYLPAISEHRSFPESDLLNALVTSAPYRPYSSLRVFGALAALTTLAWTPWGHADRRTRRVAAWVLAISAIVLVIPVKTGGFSIWMMVFRRLPGFDVIRDPTRIIYVYELAAVLAAAWLLSRFPRTAGYRVVVALVLLMSIAIDHNRDIFERYRPRAVYRRWVEAPVAIDPSCRSFFIKGASLEYMARSPHMWTLYAIDSMFISLNHSLPTLNGYSAWFPQGWNLWNPQEDDYPDRVRQWIDRHHLTGVCAFDIEARTMTPF